MTATEGNAYHASMAAHPNDPAHDPDPMIESVRLSIMPNRLSPAA